MLVNKEKTIWARVLVTTLSAIIMGCATKSRVSEVPASLSSDQHQADDQLQDLKAQPRCIGKMINGEKEGAWNCYYSNSIKSAELSFVKGRKHGLIRLFRSDGTLHIEANWKEGVMDGKTVHYFPSGGKDIEHSFSQGLLQGPAVEYYETGEVFRKSDFIKGNMQGTFREYDRLGQIIFESEIVDGVERVKYPKPAQPPPGNPSEK